MFQLSHRHTSLIPQVEWFSFPEGCKLWRGSSSPTHDHLKNGGVSSYAAGAATSARGPSLDGASSKVFDTCLGSSTSFSWFVLSTNSDDYGSKLVKTYGAVVRFYVPAPQGIDPTQDDFAQTLGSHSARGGFSSSMQKGGSSVSRRGSGFLLGSVSRRLCP